MRTHLDCRLFMVFVMCQILAIQYFCHDNGKIYCFAQSVPAVFVFGDSAVDVGNNFYINTVAKPVSPNGIDFVRGSPSGRYTNARTVADIIEEELGFENYATAYLHPNTTGDMILKGVNYASSGSGILNTTGVSFGAHISMDEQINYFAKTRQDIISRIGAQEAQALLTQSLYLISMGANDILAGEMQPIHAIYLDILTSKFKSQLRALYTLGARKIVVTNAPKIGCIPFELDIHSLRDTCVDFLNELAKSYNTILKILLSELTANLPGSKFLYADTYAMLEDILQNYRSNGFDNKNLACCEQVGNHGGLVPCATYSRVCSDRRKYVFWDPFHLTDSANMILAKHLLDGDQNFISPINIRQLVNDYM